MKKYSTEQEIDAFKKQKRKIFEKPKPEPEDVKPNNIKTLIVNVHDDVLKPNIDSSNKDKIKLEILTL